jgi:hypothetical protein
MTAKAATGSLIWRSNSSNPALTLFELPAGFLALKRSAAAAHSKPSATP